MSSRGMRNFAIVLGAAAGAVLGVVLPNSPVAHADQPFQFPDLTDMSPPGNEVPTDVQTSVLPPWYWTSQGTVQYTIIDPNTGHVGATYDATENNEAFLFASFENNITQVTDTTAGAPAVGTLWDDSGFSIPIVIGTYVLQWPVLGNDYESDPTGTTRDFSSIDLGVQLGNYFSTGPAGTLDELTFQGPGFPFIPFAIPILDLPAAASTAAATDAGSLWSDIAALF